MRLPHWFGFRAIRQEQCVRLTGRNVAVPALLALFVLVSILPLVVVSLEADRLTSEPAASLAIFVLLIGGLGGALYSATSIPMQRELIFSSERIELLDRYILGKQEADIPYSSLKEIQFHVSWPSKSLFKITHIALIQRDGTITKLVHGACPMYSWQGREAYRAIRELLDRCGRNHLLGPEPNFSYQEHDPVA